jgi:hypothetical protein
MIIRAPRVLALAAVGLLGCAGVASRDATHAPGDVAAIAGIHAHKCGSCHVAPEPKSRTRDHLDAALVRHKNRVHLTPAQWAAMIDYLAASDGSTAPQAP